MNINNQVEYWNREGVNKTFNHPLNFDLLAKNIAKNARILDYGCGYGRVMKTLSQRGYSYVEGVDFSQQMIERGRRIFPELDFQVISPSYLPYSDREFDAVLLFTVLTCIPQNEAQISLIQELKRILRVGGLLYISDLSLQSDERNLKRYQEFEKKYGTYGVFELPEGAVLRHHDRKWIESLTSNFEAIDFREFEVETMNKNSARAFQLLIRKNQ